MGANDLLGPGAARGVRGVVFDLDGVLVHSGDCHRDAYLEAFAAHGLAGIAFDYAHYTGWRTRDVVADVLARAGRGADPALVALVARDKSAAALRRIAAANPIAPDCGRVLEALGGAFRLGLASSGSRAGVDAFLDANARLEGGPAFRSRFKAVLTGDDVTRAKPAPEIFTKCFARLELTPAECLVVEDAASGIEAARAAGARVLGITGTLNRSALLGAGACGVVDTLAEIPPWLAAEGAWPR